MANGVSLTDRPELAAVDEGEPHGITAKEIVVFDRRVLIPASVLTVVVTVTAEAALAQTPIVLWDTGAPHRVLFNGEPAWVGFGCGDYGPGYEQRWSAIPFRIDTPAATITQIDADWVVSPDNPAENVNYIIWHRTGLDAPVEGDQFLTGVLGPYGPGVDDPRVPGADDWLHQYAVDIPIPTGDYYLSIYGDGGMPGNAIGWLTGADLQDESLEQGFMWRSNRFPNPGFFAYTNPGMQAVAGQDPDDLWNLSFTLYGVPEPGSAALLLLGGAVACRRSRR
jgi:hypothetical protein